MAGYGDDIGFNDWMTANGYTLPGSAPTDAVLRQRGSDWLDATYAARWRGQKVDFDQERGWPRSGVTVEGQAVPDTTTPLAIVNASYMAAWQEASSPGSLSAGVSSATGNIRRQKVEGAVEREFFSAKESMASDAPFDPNAPNPATRIMADIENLVKPYLSIRDYGAGIWAVGPDC
jgi:hypothetical protein